MDYPRIHPSGLVIWTQREWVDREPDWFTMAVESNPLEGEKFVVVSGNATWLNIQQAQEVQEYLAECIRMIQASPVITGEEQDHGK